MDFCVSISYCWALTLSTHIKLAAARNTVRLIAHPSTEISVLAPNQWRFWLHRRPILEDQENRAGGSSGGPVNQGQLLLMSRSCKTVLSTLAQGYRCLTTTYFGGILSPLPLGLLCQQMLPRVIGVLRAFFLVAPRRRFWIRDSVRDHTLGTGSLIVRC